MSLVQKSQILGQKTITKIILAVIFLLLLVISRFTPMGGLYNAVGISSLVVFTLLLVFLPFRDACYPRDRVILPTQIHLVLLGLFIIAFMSIGFFGSTYWVAIVNYMGIIIIAVLGLNLLMGLCGQISFAQVGFVAVGAYFTAISSNNLGLPFWAVILLSGLFCALAGFILGLTSLKLKGFWLAMVTLAAHFIIMWVIRHGGDMTGGGGGLSVQRPELGNIIFNTDTRFFYIIMPCVLVMIGLTEVLSRSKVGRIFTAIREDVRDASTISIYQSYYKLLAFALCSFYAGIAGSLATYYWAFAHSEFFPLIDSLEYIGFIIVGGMGTIIGPIFSTIFLILIQEGLFTMPIRSTLDRNVFTALLWGITYSIVLLALFFYWRFYNRLRRQNVTLSEIE